MMPGHAGTAHRLLKGSADARLIRMCSRPSVAPSVALRLCPGARDDFNGGRRGPRANFPESLSCNE